MSNSNSNGTSSSSQSSSNKKNSIGNEIVGKNIVSEGGQNGGIKKRGHDLYQQQNQEQHQHQDQHRHQHRHRHQHPHQKAMVGHLTLIEGRWGGGVGSGRL
ncbi:hypothetical protein CDD83_4998 [Cordyceps sp. RAO-2017]|nr:hypothetical protein CDD83_4998 [Cordyceps sp. RAO-2017]